MPLTRRFRSDGGAQSIATIPLDSFTPNGSAAVVTFFALWGLSQLLIAAWYVLVLTRYRSLIPLMYLSIIIEYLGRMAIGAWKPVVSLETPPGATGNFVLSGLGLAMLILSMRERPQRP